jgi:hypothetical protein
VNENVVADYLALYRDQTPRQAQLLIPAWAKDRLDSMPEDVRRSILDDVEQIASWHGLTTPVNIVTPEEGG